MGVRFILCVCVAFLLMVSCQEDDVDTGYQLSVSELLIKDDNGLTPVGWEELFIDSLSRKEYIGEIKFSEESRAENDRLALEKFTGKKESLSELDLLTIFPLKEGESVQVKFVYSIARDKEVLGTNFFERNVTCLLPQKR